MALTVNLNDVQHEPIIVTASLTADLNRYYVNTVTSTYTDPTPVQGEGFIVFVRNGTATVGGTAYSTTGTLIYRYYHSGAWANTSIDLTTKQDSLSISTDYIPKSNGDGTFSDSSIIDSGTNVFLIGGFSLGTSTPINLTGTTNNLSVGLTGSIIQITLTGNQTITGIDSSSFNDGQTLFLYNRDSTDIVTLSNKDALSNSTNRFDFYPVSNVTINPKEIVVIQWINGKFRLVSKINSSTGNALTSNPLSQFAATTSAQLAGVISDETGTDKLVFNTSPTFATQTSTTAITATTASNDILETLTNNSSGTPAASYGLSRLIQLKSSTTDSQTAGKEIFSWSTATHASRHSGYKLQLIGNVSIHGNVLQDVFSVTNNGNSFQHNIIAHSGYGAKLNLVSGTTTLADFQTSGANNDLYISTNTNSSTSIYLRAGNGDTMVRLNPTGMFLGGSTAPTAILNLAAGTTAKAQMKFASSTAPTTPNDGDLWFDGTDLKIRVAGATYTLVKI